MEVTPENGMILVFGDSGMHKPSEWRDHFQTSKDKNIKIFWIYTPGCKYDCDEKSKEAHEGLTEGRIYNTASELNIEEFFKEAVHTVGNFAILSLHIICSGDSFNFRFKLLVKKKAESKTKTRTNTWTILCR